LLVQKSNCTWVEGVFPSPRPTIESSELMMVDLRPNSFRASLFALYGLVMCTSKVPGIVAEEENYECPYVCFNGGGVVKPCQDVLGKNGPQHRCYDPDDVTDECPQNTYNCRRNIILPEDMCMYCAFGAGPCREDIDNENTGRVCRNYDYNVDPPECPARYRACAGETSTTTVTFTTSTSTTSTVTTATTSTSTTSITTSTVKECEYESVAGYGPCVYVLSHQDSESIQFPTEDDGSCLPGLFTCAASTTSSTSTATSTTTTTQALCNVPCALGTFGDCRDPLGLGAVCGAADDASGQCSGTTSIDCRPHYFTSSDTFPGPEGSGTPFTCDASECANYSQTGADDTNNTALVFVRKSYGHCKHPASGVCLPYMVEGGCWPGTYDCGSQPTTCLAKGTGCAWTEAGIETKGPCQHPQTGYCMDYTEGTAGECFPGTLEC
jgi:hypothetical protein